MDTLTDDERKVLAEYLLLEDADPEGAWNPYYDSVARSIDGELEKVYEVCKSLKKKGLLEVSGVQYASVVRAPSYWPATGAREIYNEQKAAA